MARTPIKYIFGGGTTNTYYPNTQTEIENGILLQSDIRSNLPNGLAKVQQSAIRDLQTMGGFYDNTQIYNLGDFVSVLISENSVIKILYFRCKQSNTTALPPVSGSNGGTADIPVYSNYALSNTTYWDRVAFKDINETSINVSNQTNVVVIGDAYKDSVFGTLKMKFYKDADLHCVANVEFFGKATEFKINSVWYSYQLRNSSNQAGGIQVAYPGFFIEIHEEKFMIGVKFLGFCDRIEFDYRDLNCPVVPSMQEYSINKPYAIREGGGTWIKDLGCVKNCMRNNNISQSGETYEFYLFSNGFVDWISAMTLDPTYYHQWANGGMASTNVDVSDAVFRNVGAKAGNTVGKMQDPQLPNIKSRTGNTGELGDSGGGTIYSMNMSGEAYSQYGCVMQDGWEGAFYAEQEKPNDVGFPKGGQFFATDQRVADGNYYMLYLKFDASRSNPIYSDSGDVRGITIVTRFKLQAF